MNRMKSSSRSPRYTQLELLRVFLRADFYAFVQKVFETVNPGVAFSRNWSTEAVTHALQKVASGATTRLIINIPPRNLKSICASVALPAYLLGRNPTRKVICVSYSDDLAAKFSNDCRAVMRTDWYHQTFPRARIDKAKDTEAEVRTRTRISPGHFCRGHAHRPGWRHHHYRRLSRYEATLWRQVGQILFALDALDRRKPQDRRRRFLTNSRPGLPLDEGEGC
jgi:hypothetical protein